MDLLRIYIVCQKPEICHLITKSLGKELYEIKYIYGDAVTEKTISGIDGIYDCLIIDEEIGERFSAIINAKFKDSKIICLPSLNNDCHSVINSQLLSEPLKLSELKEAVLSIKKASQQWVTKRKNIRRKDFLKT